MGLAERSKTNTARTASTRQTAAMMHGRTRRCGSASAAPPADVAAHGGRRVRPPPGLRLALTEIRADWVPDDPRPPHDPVRGAGAAVAADAPRVLGAPLPGRPLVDPPRRGRHASRDRHRPARLRQDFPHWEGIWPNTAPLAPAAFGGVPETSCGPSSARTPRLLRAARRPPREVAERIGPAAETSSATHGRRRAASSTSTTAPATSVPPTPCSRTRSTWPSTPTSANCPRWREEPVRPPEFTRTHSYAVEDERIVEAYCMRGTLRDGQTLDSRITITYTVSDGDITSMTAETTPRVRRRCAP